MARARASCLFKDNPDQQKLKILGTSLSSEGNTPPKKRDSADLRRC